MSKWIENLKTNLRNKEVLILHGNVRDKYIDPKTPSFYGNLTSLIQDVAGDVGLKFNRVTFYDVVGKEKEQKIGSSPAARSSPGSDLSSTSSSDSGKDESPVSRQLAKWARELSATKESLLATIFYLDKLASYRQGGYTSEDRQTILRLEKLIENITSNNRLVMVALQDSMVPVELYTNSPKVAVLLIPSPDKEDRMFYLKRPLDKSYSGEQLKQFDGRIEFLSNLTDGLFLRDLDNIVKLIQGLPKGIDTAPEELRRLINKYRLGDKEDYWGTLSIKKLDTALGWFVKKQGVLGQDDAVQKVIDIMMVARAGLSGLASGTASKPKGVLFFAGPSGVGRTFLAKKLAEFLFGSEDAFIRFDMSEFMEDHTGSKLIGSPPGYVGHEEGGKLTNSVRARPFSVVLFDEIEKAHPRILDIFLQILDDGRLTDSRGQTVFFTETVIIFTSNIGTRTKDSHGRDSWEKGQLDEILEDKSLTDEERRARLQRHFLTAVTYFVKLELSRPELLNRIGSNIVPFNRIDDAETQREIVRSNFNRIQKKFQEDLFKVPGHKLDISPSLVDYLVAKHQSKMSEFGGRAIDGAIHDEIILTLARPILDAEYSDSRNVVFKVDVVDVKEGKIGVSYKKDNGEMVTWTRH